MSQGVGGAISSEEAVMVFGVLGFRPNGTPFARAGLYGFSTGTPTFRCAINFDTTNANLFYRFDSDNKPKLSESDNALLNWVRGGLFGADIKAGSYYMKMDQVKRLIPNKRVRIHRDDLPKRLTFSGERRLESAIEMWSEFLDKDENSLEYLMPPISVSLVSPNRVPKELREFAASIPLPLFQVPKPAFRRYAIKLFMSGLRIRNGNYLEIQSSYVRAFETLDTMIGKVQSVVLDGMLERIITGIRNEANKHVMSLGPAHEAGLRYIETAMQCLVTYTYYQTNPGFVSMHLPPMKVESEAVTSDPAFKKIQALFKEPMFTLVKAVPPVQVIDNYMSTGDFPFNGLELFRKQ